MASQINGLPSAFPYLLQYAEPNSLGLSLLILFVWVFGLIGLSAVLFKRQDVTT